MDAVVTEYMGVNPYLPSKLSDYLGSDTPIWAIVEKGSSLDLFSTNNNNHKIVKSYIGNKESHIDVLKTL